MRHVFILGVFVKIIVGILAAFAVLLICYKHDSICTISGILLIVGLSVILIFSDEPNIPDE
ncbi:MAG: hypothetical protein D3909_04330 [Candidatus Electrothrix sp. ATG1]|nr:hypothetical protein [Candidatus Electrothrix sp. ATG1]